MVFKFHFDFGIMRTSDDLFSQSLRLKRHDYGSQHPYLRQTLDISYCCLSKDIGFYRVPICQFDDLRCAAFKIKPKLTQFAVVVCLIQVDSGGNFFVIFAAFSLLQRHGMDKAAFQQLQAQFIQCSPV